MAKLKSVAHMGYPDHFPPSRDLPYTEITPLSTDDDEVTLVVDDEEVAHAGDAWGLYIVLTTDETRALAGRLMDLVGQPPTGS